LQLGSASDARFSSELPARYSGVPVALRHGVAEKPLVPGPDRRLAARGDRRRNSRSGRRTDDPHTNWRRIAWLFAAYAIYLTVCSLPDALKSLPTAIKTLPDTVKKMFRKEPTAPA